jgi:hypothetical protein
MSSRALPVSLALAAALQACGGEEAPPPPPTRLAVEVIDAATASPIPNAAVLVQGAWRTTDEAGRLELELAPGSVRLRAQALGYLPHPRPRGAWPAIEVLAERTTSARLALEPRPEAGASGWLAGRVVRDGQPVEGALVVGLSTVEVTGHTDREGRYAIAAPASTFVVVAYLGGSDSSRVAGVPVRAGETTEVAEVTLSTSAGVPVEGTLAPARGATRSTTVTLAHPASGEPVPGLSVVAAFGEAFRIDGVAPGTYALEAALEDDGTVLAVEPELQARPVQVTVGSAPPEPIALGTIPAIAGLSPVGTATVAAVPTLAWTAAAEADFYVVEVVDALGRNVWGGFDARGSWRFTVLPPATRIAYAGPALAPGRTYGWRVFAARRDAVVQTSFTIVAASEALAGTLTIDR